MKLNLVEPIRDKNKIDEMKYELKKSGTRNYMLFFIGINTGLRISDILNLKCSDIKNSDGTMKSHISIIEKKTKKNKKFPIANSLYSELERFTRNMQPNDYIFKSQKGNNLSYSQAYRTIKSAATNIDLQNIGTHTLRKTFGYHHYKKFGNLPLLQKIFNHSSSSVTLRYIGLEQDIIDESYNNFYL